MGRKRKHDKHLPPGWYKAGRRFRRRIYIGQDRKPGWEYVDTLQQAADIIERENGTRQPGGIARGIARYTLEIMPKKLAPETQRTEEPRLEQLSRVFGHMDPDDVTQQHIYQYLDARPLVGGQREISRLGAVYREMIRWGMATTNPCANIMRESEPARDRYINDDELELALAVCLDRAMHGSRSAIVVYAVMRLEYLTGRRESTILQLQLADRLDEGLAFNETKVARRNRRGDVVKEPRKIIVEWSPDLRQAVADIRRLCRLGKVSSLYLIPNRDGGKNSTGSFNQAWQKLRPWMGMAGIQPFQPRDIRAKHNTDFDEADLGHSDERVTYKHYQRKPKKLKPLK